ncbi:hypothetical protein AXG93_3217s1370 [Marchantia polymorpha subsp. ruderalis]|uniref:N-acyl-aliphatic-L-amino acid amidohydrolase n=1 Tax=Marchantia polymorpha subsp. ruderalis TaxID=1480154 RepID=A0A176VXP6_MARPO|nr:hypothetical protein AXG93_3217s1370 [Marchantia polymorpha subsp. ruderalis]
MDRGSESPLLDGGRSTRTKAVSWLRLSAALLVLTSIVVPAALWANRSHGALPGDGDGAGPCHCKASDMGDPPPGCITRSENSTYDGNPLVERFRRYLRIRTDHPEPNYCCAVAYLRGIAEDIGGLETMEVSYGKSTYKPFLIVTWRGTDPGLPSILLNSHTDVVQADPSNWRHDPFCAFMEENGDIFARGAQDCKDSGMHYLEAIRELKRKSFVPVRTIHVVYTPDEEIAGEEGFESFVASEQFRGMNVGVAIDEGGATPGDSFRVFRGEKAAWWLTITAFGKSCHGSVMLQNGAIENLIKSMNSIMAYRQTLLDLVAAGVDDSSVASISPTYLSAGVTTATGYVSNIQPEQASAGFDIRISPLAPEEGSDILNLIKTEWAPKERNMSYEFGETEVVTVVDDSNPWWSLLKNAILESGHMLQEPLLASATSDSRNLRLRNISAFNFAAVSNTIDRVHGVDEYLNAGIYLAGVPVFENIIKAFSSFS